MNGRVIVLAVLFMCILSASVHAAAIGVNKAVMNFDGVLRGGYAQDSVWVSTDTDEPVQAFILAEGDTASWFRFEPNSSNVSKNAGANFRVIVEPPADTPNGDYEVVLRVGTGPLSTPTGQYGSAIRAGFRIRAITSVTSDQRLSCDAGGFVIRDSEEGFPLLLSYVVSNTGNVRVQPRFSYDIWDKYQEILIGSGDVQAPGQTLPTVTESFDTQIPESGLKPGQYWMNVKSEPCGEESLLTFSVVERGQISDKGELMRIDSPTWVKVEDIVPITAVFRNKGPRIVAATFNGQVLLNDHLVGVLTSETLNVEPDGTIELATFFTPRQPGQYTVAGRVTYNQKVTFEKRSLFNAQSTDEYVKKKGFKQAGFIAGSALIIVLIIVFIALIARRQRRHR